ncbi:hypothetical protein B0H11DRAFT_2225478 [Mycena galericulata]|nr:hypothetical protein B0H11DRAFT_2225478 [Mycena galericulata]
MERIDYDTAALKAMYMPLPGGLESDDYLRSSSDAPDDFESAYQRACAHSVQMGTTRVGWLWRHALEIGLRAGIRRAADGEAKEFARGKEAGLKEGRSGGLRDGKQDGRKAGKKEGGSIGLQKSQEEALKKGSVRRTANGEAKELARGKEAGMKEGRTGGLRDGNQDAREVGMAHGLNEGEAIGFHRGQKEGLEEGKRLGFVAGKEFGEKQSLKFAMMERILVDAGTDPPTAPVLIDVATMTDVPQSLSATPLPPVNWPETDPASTSSYDLDCVLTFIVRHVRPEQDRR